MLGAACFNGCLSSTFTIERDGSVLSPVIFLLVMKALLQGLEAIHLVPSLHDIYIGAFAHADDITINLRTLKQQVKFVQGFLRIRVGSSPGSVGFACAHSDAPRGRWVRSGPLGFTWTRLGVHGFIWVSVGLLGAPRLRRVH